MILPIWKGTSGEKEVGNVNDIGSKSGDLGLEKKEYHFCGLKERI